MNRSETTTTCENALDLIDQYLDGELDDVGNATLESHLVSCSGCAAELEFARRVNAGLDSLSLHKCPPDVLDTVLAHAKKAGQAPPLPRRDWVAAALEPLWRPALAGAVAVLLLLATAYVGQNGNQASPQYTRAELEQAQEQAKWTLVFISQLSRKATSDLKRDVLDPHVVREMMRVIDPKSNLNSKENGHAS